MTKEKVFTIGKEKSNIGYGYMAENKSNNPTHPSEFGKATIAISPELLKQLNAHHKEDPKVKLEIQLEITKWPTKEGGKCPGISISLG